MTTKDIKAKCALYFELPRTNRFKRAIDVVLGQNIPFAIDVAAPFKCFKGKKGRYKVRVRNTRTGENLLLCKTKVEERAHSWSFISKGRNLIGGSIESWRAHYSPNGGHRIGSSYVEDLSYYLIDENTPRVDVWAHSQEVIEETGWAYIGYVISKLFKSDMVYFETCGKCGGSGFIPAFAHVANGICFDCLGCGGRLQEQAPRKPKKVKKAPAPESVDIENLPH